LTFEVSHRTVRFACFDTRPGTGIFMETIVPDEEAAAMFAATKRGDF